MTLCFVLCPFDFGVLTISFCILCTMMHILKGAIHEVEPRWRTNEERNTEYKYFNSSVLMLVYIYTFEIYAASNYHSQKVYQWLSVDSASYWVLTVKVVTHTHTHTHTVLFNIIQFESLHLYRPI